MRDTWGLLLFLGAFHGVNPGMGWLFAVALGMQENRSDAVWRALLPIGLGHAFAIGAVVLVGIVAGVVVPLEPLRWIVAAFLVGLGVLRLVRHRYPRWGSMRIGQGRLMLWSFLVATAHGAGLMVLPVWLHMSLPTAGHGAHVSAGGNLASGLAATAVHTSSYLIVTAVIAWIVFHKLGVGLLRKAWINLDLIWAAALIATGVLTAMLPAWSALSTRLN
jgi:hypothetical protein